MGFLALLAVLPSWAMPLRAADIQPRALYMNLPPPTPEASPSTDKIEGVVTPVNPWLAAPGESFKETLYTKPKLLEKMEDGTFFEQEKERDGTFQPEFVRYERRPFIGERAPLPDLLKTVVEATEAAIANVNAGGQEAYGDWMGDKERLQLIEALRGLRGRKLVWWLDAPRPLRVVAARSAKYEISILCLPRGQQLPPAAVPRGSVILCQPLLGQFDVRRLRFDITGKASVAPIELMRRTLKHGDVKLGAPLLLSGGSCHEFIGKPGIASAFLQVAMLPPTSNFPQWGDTGDGSIGWRRPPGETTEQNDDVVAGVAIGVHDVSEVLEIDRPSEESLARERELDRGAAPSTAPKLVTTLGQRVGGLEGPIGAIVRRALASRLYPPEITRDLGIRPVRGLLLYGPPGCGKTLLAREISAAMGARPPKIVNSPEMMSKFVGDSEEFVRALFAEAEAEQAEAGDASALHVIVFDEMDAFTRERGSLTGDTSGIRDSVVNQLLAKMDGVEQLDNILVIGMTNRPELMDPALLRPGRLEVQVLVPLPDTDGRTRILGIHSRQLRERGCLDARAAAALSSGSLAQVTEGYSGADLAGLLRAAASYSLERYVEEAMLSGIAPGAAVDAKASKRPVSSGRVSSGRRGLLEVRYDDLVRALRETRPTGSSATRSELAEGSGRGLMASLSLRVRGLRREARLHKLTERAMAAQSRVA